MRRSAALTEPKCHDGQQSQWCRSLSDEVLGSPCQDVPFAAVSYPLTVSSQLIAA